MSEAKNKTWLGSLFGTLYFLVCLLLWLAYLAFEPLNAYGIIHITVNDLQQFASGMFDSISDPVLRALIYILLGIIAIILVPGVIGVGLWLLVVVVVGGISLAFVLLFIQELIILSKVSVTGAIVAFLVGGTTLFLLFRWLSRRLLPPLLRYARPVLEMVYGVFFDWWLTPILRRRKEKRIMDDVQKKRERYERAVLVLKTECPEVANIPMTLGDATWLEHLGERFRDGQVQKTLRRKKELVTQAKEYFAEYRAALDAQDSLQRAAAEFAEKDEEAEIRVLDRKKRKLTLTREIEDLEKKPEPPAPAPKPKGTSEQRKVAEHLRLEKERQRELAKCKGDAKCEERVNRIYDDADFKALEGR